MIRIIILLGVLSGSLPMTGLAATEPVTGSLQGTAVVLRYRKIYAAAPGNDQLLEIIVYQSGHVDAYYPSFFRYPGRHQLRLSAENLQQLNSLARQLPDMDQADWLRRSRQEDRKSDNGGEFRVIADQDITEIWYDRGVSGLGQTQSKPFHLLADGLTIRARLPGADASIRHLAAVDDGIWRFLNQRIVTGVEP